jgi:hypothetical protein
MASRKTQISLDLFTTDGDNMQIEEDNQNSSNIRFESTKFWTEKIYYIILSKMHWFPRKLHHRRKYRRKQKAEKINDEVW